MEQNIILRNNVKISGKGTKPILFAAGFGCDQTVWRDITKAFEEDYKVILFDYVGAGQSDISQYDPVRYGTLEGYAQDVLDVCESLDLRETVLVGHSVGSMIGMIASLKKPEFFSDLVMIGPSPCYLNFPPDYMGGFEREQLVGLLDMLDKNFIGWANYFSGVVTNNAERPDVRDEMEERFCSTDPVIAKQFAEATFFSDYRKELKSVTVPTLIMQCSEDIIAPANVGQYMHENMKDSVLVQMEAEGHCPHLCSPEETITVILNYLNMDTLVDGAGRRGFIIEG